MLDYNCDCGETYSECAHAWDCKKCRRYLSDDQYRRRRVNIYHQDDGDRLATVRLSDVSLNGDRTWEVIE